MKEIQNDPSLEALAFIRLDKMWDNLWDKLSESNVLADEVTKNLQAFLEKKRLYFPR